MPASHIQALAVADAALGLPFLLGRTKFAGIDVEAHHASIYTILLVDLSPGAAAGGDAGLEVVDPVDRGHAAEPAVGLVVDVMPGELVHRPAPDDGLLAAVAEDHDEGVDRRRAVGVAEVDAAELAPVALGLGPGRGLDPPERADRGPAVAGPHELADGLVRAVIAVLGAEELVEELDAGRPPLAQELRLALPPVGDGLDQAELLDERGLLPTIGRRLLGAAEMVAHGSFGDAEDPGRLPLRLTALLQYLDRHDLLPCERRQGSASELAVDVRVQLGSAWLACRWMFSTTAVLNACQARNDSGSLSSSFTGSVTRSAPGWKPMAPAQRRPRRRAGLGFRRNGWQWSDRKDVQFTDLCSEA